MLLYTLMGLRQLICLSPPDKWDPADSVETYAILTGPGNLGSTA